MSILWPFRQQCSLFLFQHLTSDIIRPITMAASIHTRARQSPYSGTKDVQRATVADEKVPWNVVWPAYKPVEYTAPKVLKNPEWADSADASKIKHYNEVDGGVNRTSYLGKYEIAEDTNRPRNPQGRTGLSGRGLLGRWGPNHAGDPVVTRWAKDQSDRTKKVLEVILIIRSDHDDMALPGGMVDSGEQASDAVKREFFEEALDSNPDDTKQIDELFKTATSVYQGYIDDPRNTDNAWMESEAFNMHDETGKLTKDLNLKAGDDAKEVKWVRLDRDLKLYASHQNIIQRVVNKLGAYQYWHDK